MKNLIVISADRRGDCFVGASFDEETRLLTIKYLVEDICDRYELASQLTHAIEDLFPLSSAGDEIAGFISIDNRVLDTWLGENLIVRGKGRHPHNSQILQPKEAMYKLGCALQEKKLIADGWLDRIDVALAAETEPERIEGHLATCLAAAVDKFYDSIYRPVSIHRGMVRR